MDLVSGETEPDWAGRLARTPFAAALATGAPLVIASGAPLGLAFATPAALAAFGAAGAGELEPILFAAGGFASRRLRRLATETPVNAAPRLELLRFFVARKAVNANWLCARLEREGETFFVAGEPTAGTSPAEEPAPITPAEDDAPFTPIPLDGPVRFVWRLNPDAKFAPPDPAVRARVGRNAPREGETPDAFLARVGLDPEDKLGQALRGEATFSGLRLAWPEPGGARARIVLLSGAPTFANNREFQGFRGFGIFTGEGVDLAPPPPAYVTPPPEAATDFSETPTLESESPQAPSLARADAPLLAADDVREPFETPPSPNEAPIANPVVEPPALQAAPVSADSQGPAPAAAPAENIGSEPPKAGGDNALVGFLQRQAPMTGANSNGAVPSPPAMAVISALASLLQPKSEKPAAPPEPPASPPTTEASPHESGGAEIVMLRPGPSAPPANDRVAAQHSRESDAVSLSLQERDAFKEIARALGANVRSGRGEPRASADDTPPPNAVEPAKTPETPAAPPVRDDFPDLVDNLPIAVLVIRGRETLYANRTLLDLTGYKSLEDFRRRDGLTMIFRGRDPETLAAGSAGIPLVAAGERVMTVDAQIRTAKWEGAAAVLVAMRRSLEADHQAELRAMERETDMHAARARDFAAALDAARDGMVRLDRNGRVLGMNKGAERLFGANQNETAGDNFLELFAPSSHADAATALQRVVVGASEPFERLDVVARDHEGRQFPVRIEIGRFANQPEPDYFLLLANRTAGEGVAAVDPTALEEAERASRAKSELLSRVSHEMRTPLHAIMGFAEVILEGRFGPLENDRYRDYVKDILASAKHTLALAGDLLDMSKIELGKMDLKFAPIDLNAVIRECVTIMQPQAARERIIMRLSLYDRLPHVTADERSLKQIMLNLMSNAVKYNEPGGQVIVSTALDDDGAVIAKVRDTGVGMNESDLAIALEPFRRIPGAKAVEGAGLGLPLTKALVEANHADFAIKSRKDQGTLVEISFPAAKAAQ